MYRAHKIGLVIPARNEERLIVPTLAEVPEIIDLIYVVNDGSTDRTAQVVQECAKKDPRVVLLNHVKNSGPGQAIVTGYQQASVDQCEVVVVIGGDHQMPLDCVTDFIDPIIDGKVDYTKGNRFVTGKGAFDRMPKIRLIGNIIITAMTKIASGYYKTVDVVDGYTAISKRAIDAVRWEKTWKGYGYPMNFLIHLNMYGFKIADIARDAIYREGERQSQIKGVRYALRVSPMLIRGFFWRIINRYLFRSFHPLVIFYLLGLFLFPLGFLYGLRLVFMEQVMHHNVTAGQSILCALFIITGIQFILFAMLFDMQESH